MSSEFFANIKDNVIGSLTSIYQLIPDSILFGSILLYFLTQNMAFGVFGVFIFETVLSHRFISWMFSQSVGSRSLTQDKIKCYSGFKTPQFNATKIFDHDQYPPYGVFSLTSIGTYLLLATSEFTDTFVAMGPDWASRRFVAYGLISFVLLSYYFARFAVGCDSIGDMMISIGCALVVGSLFFYINKKLFGVEGMNFLGLPYLVSKESEGSPIYVCAVQKST
jgi:hypothetical protein